MVFVERYRAITRHGQLDDLHEESVVADLISTINFFSLNEEVDNMVDRNHMYQTSAWKRLAWERAWALDEMMWKIEFRLQKTLDLVCAINPNPRYLTWWALSDRYPEYTSM